MPDMDEPELEIDEEAEKVFLEFARALIKLSIESDGKLSSDFYELCRQLDRDPEEMREILASNVLEIDLALQHGQPQGSA